MWDKILNIIFMRSWPRRWYKWAISEGMTDEMLKEHIRLFYIMRPFRFFIMGMIAMFSLAVFFKMNIYTGLAIIGILLYIYIRMFKQMKNGD